MAGVASGIVNDRCDVCGEPCVSGRSEGKLWAGYHLWVHLKVCDSIVHDIHKDFSKSPRGRKRSGSEVRAILSKMIGTRDD